MTLTERALLIAAAILMTLACVGWYAGAPHPRPAVKGDIGAMSDVGVATPESIDVAARVVAETDPFRLDRRPASVRYRPDLEGVAPPPKPPKPALVLAGVVGGAALVDGVPGRTETVIVRAGDTLAGLRVRRVGRDTVVITGADTTWRLTLRHPWQ